jgi:hypothetical protein
LSLDALLTVRRIFQEPGVNPTSGLHPTSIEGLPPAFAQLAQPGREL